MGSAMREPSQAGPAGLAATKPRSFGNLLRGTPATRPTWRAWPAQRDGGDKDRGATGPLPCWKRPTSGWWQSAMVAMMATVVMMVVAVVILSLVYARPV